MREEAELFNGDVKLFGFRSVPRVKPAGAVVICSTVLAESARNYRREVLLARSLAQRGFVAQRFHYEGSGNSDGTDVDVTIETMVSDALAASEHLIAMTGVNRVAFMGSRLGALIAAMAAARSKQASLILWEPVVDVSGYFREVFRSQLVFGLRNRAPNQPTEALETELRRSGSVDILGWSFHESLYHSGVDRTLEAELGDEVREVLLIQIGRQVALRTEYRDLADRWRHKGFAVQTHTVKDQPDWWFSGEQYWVPNETRDSTQVLNRITVEWMIHSTEGIEQ